MGEALEVAKVVVSPIEKLIDAVRAAIGKAYDPRYVKRMADAEAYKIDKLASALRGSSDMPIIYDSGEIKLDTTGYDEFIRRAQSRLSFQELCKERNIETIIGKTYMLLESETDVSSEPVDPDWMIRFFNSVEDISNETMQVLWSKLLAGEIKRPHSFSLRTLETLKNMTQREAQMFCNIAPYVLHCPSDASHITEDYFLFDLDEQEKYYGHYTIIHLLAEAGLISDNNLITAGLELSPDEINCFVGKSHSLLIHNFPHSELTVSARAYLLTAAGAELLQLISVSNTDITEYLETCREVLLEEYSQIEVSIIENN